MKIYDSSHQYQNEKLRKMDLSLDPIEQFHRWFLDAASCFEANAISLATATKEGRPSCRTVLLKSFDEKGFVFYTHYTSRKGKELLDNPYATALLLWKETLRQITIEGRVEKTTFEDAESYFSTRPRGSQLGALASEQGKVIASREVLEKKFEDLEKQFEGEKIPRPPYWGGFRIVPYRLEFWQGMKNRMHDRFQYTLTDGKNWKIERISP